MIRFTENLDYLLHKNHMTRAELAAKLGIARSTVTSWYNKSCDGMSLNTFIAISELFGVSLDELAKGEIEKKDDTFTPDEISKLKELLSRADDILKGGENND